MTQQEFRRIALGLTGVVEQAHMNHPDFRVNGRIFATLSEDGRRGMVKLTPEQQHEFIRAHRAVFTPASGAWGRQGCTMVQLSAAGQEVVGEAMTLAWATASAMPPPKRRTPAKRASAARAQRSRR